MSEERPVVPAPEVLDAEAPASVAEVVGVVEPERRSKRDSSSSSRRRGGRAAMRIPDDEVVRPRSSPPDTAPHVPASSRPPSGAARTPSGPASVPDGANVVTPTRIITINPPEPPPTESAAVEVPAMAPTPRAMPEDSWTPFQPSVAEAGGQAPESEPVPESIEPDDDAEAAHRDSGEEVHFDDGTASHAVPLVDVVHSDGERRSDPGDAPEISVEDMVAEESLPPMRLKLPSQPPVLPAVKKPSQPAKPPLVIIPPHLGVAAPQPDAAAVRRKGRLWWEDLFNDDYVRTMEKITDGQIAREVDFIEESLSIERGGAVLDLACGTGRHAIELARRGYEVVAFDLSLSMLARAGEDAQDREAKLNFVQGDMREMAFDEQFDGIYSWNTSFGYFEEDKNAQVIDRLHRALKAGGMFLLDVVNRDFIIRQSPSLAWFEGDGCVCMDEMSVDFITSRMKVKRTMMLDDGRSREIEYSMRIYSLHELGKMLHEHGFKVTEVSGRTACPGVFFGNESPRIIIRAEKR